MSAPNYEEFTRGRDRDGDSSAFAARGRQRRLTFGPQETSVLSALVSTDVAGVLLERRDPQRQLESGRERTECRPSSGSSTLTFTIDLPPCR